MKVLAVNIGTLLLLTVFISVMLFIIQRAERKRRWLVALIMLVVAELIRRYVFYRDVHAEAWIALAAALVINFLFWLLIGRYNPPHSSDEIQVIGLDD